MAGQGRKCVLSDEQIDAICNGTDTIDVWAARLMVSRQTIIHARQIGRDRSDAMVRRQRARQNRSERIRATHAELRAKLLREIAALMAAPLS